MRNLGGRGKRIETQTVNHSMRCDVELDWEESRESTRPTTA